MLSKKRVRTKSNTRTKSKRLTKSRKFNKKRVNRVSTKQRGGVKRRRTKKSQKGGFNTITTVKTQFSKLLEAVYPEISGFNQDEEFKELFTKLQEAEMKKFQQEIMEMEEYEKYINFMELLNYLLNIIKKTDGKKVFKPFLSKLKETSENEMDISSYLIQALGDLIDEGICYPDLDNPEDTQIKYCEEQKDCETQTAGTFRSLGYAQQLKCKEFKVSLPIAEMPQKLLQYRREKKKNPVKKSDASQRTVKIINPYPVGQDI